MKYILLFVLLIGSCKSSEITSIDIDENNKQEIPFEIILESATGGKTSASLEEITNVNELEDIYSLINKSLNPKIELPAVDFDNETLVALFMGEKNTGGFNITVTKVTSAENSLIVNYSEKSPSPTDMVTMAITQPFCIVKINSSVKQLVFNRVK